MKNLAHMVFFYGNPKPGAKPSPLGVNYVSNDLRVIDTQLDLIERTGHAGVIALWYGGTDAFIHDACQKTLFLCEKRQLLFGLCVDPWAMGADKATLSPQQKSLRWQVLLDLARPFLESPAYLPERYIIDFATGADFTAVKPLSNGAAVTPTILHAYQEMSWPKAALGPAAKVNLIQQNSTAVIPGIMHSFDDHDPAAPANSIWGGGAAARRIDAEDGMVELDLVSGLNPVTAKYCQTITWNDYRERTSVERTSISQAMRLGYDVRALL